MMTRVGSRRGFTLLEVLIASSIMFITLGMASMAFLSQNKTLQAMDMSRVASESSRDALVHLEGALRNAGSGIEPRFALDLSYECPTTPCRDKTDAPDELVFVSRNPSYRVVAASAPSSCPTGSLGDPATNKACYWGNAWPIVSGNLAAAANPPTLTLTLPANTVLERGRVVQVVCTGAQKPVMITLSARAANTGSSPASVTLVPELTDRAPYNDLTGLKADTCHGAVTSSVFLVDRYRYFVTTPPGSNDPWLMLDTGLDLNNNGTASATDDADWVPIARNVLDMQVAYVLTPSGAFTAPDSNRDWIIGNDSLLTTGEEPKYGSITVGSTVYTAPEYATSVNHASRFTLSSANVRAVRVNLTLRAARPDPNRGAAWEGDALPGAENRAASTLQVEGRQLFTTQSQVTLRNMSSRSSFTF